MKRAEVVYNRWGDHEVNGKWLAEIYEGEIPERHLPISIRGAEGEEYGFPTHRDALDYAIAVTSGPAE